MTKYNEDYLNSLIAKAEKSWEGVDVDSFMSELRDDLSDKEVAEKLSKEATSYITEQIKYNMDAVTIKCRDFMVGDFVCLKDDTKYELPLKVDGIIEDDISLEGDGFLGGIDGLIRPIPITPEILEKNGWKEHSYTLPHNLKEYFYVNDEKGIHLVWKRGTLSIWFAYNEDNDGIYSDIVIPVKYVHQLQQVLRIAGLMDMANNFKV